MTKKNLRKILEALFAQKDEDDKLQEASNTYHNIIFPDSHTPIRQQYSEKQLDILRYVLSEDQIDWIEYFLYEADTFYPKCKITSNEAEHIITCDKDAIAFIINEISNT